MRLKLLILTIIFNVIPIFAQAISESEGDSVIVVEEYEDGDSISFTESFLAKSQIECALDTIRCHYPQEWKELSMQGKLSFDGLPLRPTVKLYMERGVSVIVSARAPIVGEVARIEMSKDSITFINKHSRKFMSINLQRYSQIYPGIMSDIQDVLLGQIAFPGHGRLNKDLADKSYWIDAQDDAILLMPGTELQYAGLQYGFVLNPLNYALTNAVLEFAKDQMILELSYIYGSQGWTLMMEVEKGSYPLGGELQLSYPDYSPMPLQFTEIGDKYQRTDLKGLMKF